MSEVASNLWQAVVDKVKNSIGQEKYNLWFSPLKPLSFEDNIFCISVPNDYFSQWVRDNQQSDIEEILSNSCGKKVILEFKAQENIPELIKNTEETIEVETFPQVFAHLPNDQVNPRYLFSNFVIGASNRFACGCSEAVAKNPGKQFNPLFIYSGVGLGKTHLLHAIGNCVKQLMPKLRVLYVTCETFVNEFVESIASHRTSEFKRKYRKLDCILVDDIQFLMKKEGSQEEFFNMFNDLFNSKKQIVLSSDRPPKDLEKVEERIISRFEWGCLADIQPPDLETRIAILRKKAQDEKLFIPDDVIIYIATNVKSNIRQLEGCLIKIAALALYSNVPLNVDTAKNILKDIVRNEDGKNISVETIQKIVANEFNIDFKDMKSKRRTDAIAFPRQIAMYLARTLVDEFSTNKIGEMFGGRDHATVMYACDKIKEKVTSDPYFNAKINGIIKKIKNHE
ncbi:MAG: chromosomal replication initiator protein DnaA [Elusimicrobiota bacterium]|jgi:chromosomal replication initiator protein|nr:chromosomal replication initiator protein DnaA [Elusimicrobiota bacterium]